MDILQAVGTFRPSPHLPEALPGSSGKLAGSYPYMQEKWAGLASERMSEVTQSKVVFEMPRTRQVHNRKEH